MLARQLTASVGHGLINDLMQYSQMRPSERAEFWSEFRRTSLPPSWAQIFVYEYTGMCEEDALKGLSLTGDANNKAIVGK